MDMLSVDDCEFPLVRSKSDTNFMKRLNNSRSKYKVILVLSIKTCYN